MKTLWADLPPEEFKKRFLEMVEWFAKRDINKDDPSDVRGFPTSAAAMFLARESVNMNSGFTRISLRGYTIKDEDKGDWEITVRKVTPWITFIRKIEDGWSWLKNLPVKKQYGMKAEDILNMEKLTSLTITLGNKK